MGVLGAVGVFGFCSRSSADSRFPSIVPKPNPPEDFFLSVVSTAVVADDPKPPRPNPPKPPDFFSSCFLLEDDPNPNPPNPKPELACCCCSLGAVPNSPPIIPLVPPLPAASVASFMRLLPRPVNPFIRFFEASAATLAASFAAC